MRKHGCLRGGGDALGIANADQRVTIDALVADAETALGRARCESR